MNATQSKAAISKLLKGRTFAPAIEGTPFWLTDMSTSTEVPLKVYLSSKSKIYLKLDAELKKDRENVNLGNLYDEIQDADFEKDGIVMCTVAIRTPNPDITPEELERCVEAFGVDSVKNYNAAIKDGYESITLLEYVD